MYLGSPSSSTVPDSEIDDDDQCIFFNPIRDISVTNNDPGENRPTERQRHNIKYLSDQENGALNRQDGKIESSRCLRKRKAIQKLPYSLERIKHQQLLKGYNIASFEDACENLRFSQAPKKADTISEKQERDSYNEGLNWSEEEKSASSREYLSSSSTEDRLVRPPQWSDKRQDSYLGLEQIEDHEVVQPGPYAQSTRDARVDDQIMFRGKLVNIKTGYKGVLPRIAWEKSFAGTSKGKRHIKRDLILGQKGVAKRRLIPRKNKQDDALMSDLIASDEDAGGDARDIYQVSDKPDAQHLQDLSEYFQGKYADVYLSDDGSSSPELLELHRNMADPEIGEAGSVMFEASASGIKPLRPLSDSEIEEDCKTELTSFGNESDPIAMETDNHAIDALLLKKNRIRTKCRNISTNHVESSSLRRIYRHFPRKATPSNVIQRSKRHVRSDNDTLKLSFIERLTENGVAGNRRKAYQQKKKRKSLDKGVLLNPGIYPGHRSELNRPVNVFRTVIEQPSHKYAFRVNSNPRILSHDFPRSHEKSNEEKYSPLAVIDALLKNKILTTPDVIRVNLSNKEYTLSKLDDNEIVVTLKSIFAHILDFGVTDIELVRFSHSLSLFLFQYNKPGLYNAIYEFDKKFTIKVSQLREKTKGIHFYQIAVCQLLFLEMTKCSDMAQKFKLDIENHIFKNVASFFRLLSVVKNLITDSHTSYLPEAYEILSSIITVLHADRLWSSFGVKKFEPSILLTLVKLFPVEQEKWDLLQLENNYLSMVDAVKFVDYCIQHLDWTVTSGLVLQFYDLFKRRRFEDFSEEEIMTTQNYVITSYMQTLHAGTIFNSFLSILRSISLSSSLVERIVPMGEVSQSGSPSVLANRMNLLILLAENSSINLEKRVEELIRPLLAAHYLKIKNDKSLRIICSYILNGTICLFEINCLKKHTFRSKSIVAVFKALIFDHDSLADIWNVFLERLEAIWMAAGHSYTSMLKGLYPCFILMKQKESFSRGVIILLRLYMSNLSQLGTSWTQNNLFQAIKNFEELSNGWIDYYCKIGQFLIKKQVMSWWSFFMYNAVHGSISHRIYFNYKVIQLCDSQSFDLIKLPLFTMAVDEIFRNESPLFISFLKQLMNRESGTLIDSSYKKTELGTLHLTKRLFSTLYKLSYDDLTLKLISRVRESYQNKELTITFLKPLIEYMNMCLMDLMKDSHDFLFLKRELGISDEEADKSSFRWALKSQNDPILQACYVEAGLIHACKMTADLSNYMEKLYSLFSFPPFSDPFAFFVDLIQAHLGSTPNTNLSRIRARITFYYMKLLNGVLLKKFLLVTPNEFLELCKLHKSLCDSISLTALLDFVPDQSLGRDFLCEILRYQLNILRISDGFWESDLLMAESKKFLDGGTEPSNEAKTTLTCKIDEILLKNIHINFGESRETTPQEKDKLMHALRDFLFNRGGGP